MADLLLSVEVVTALLWSLICFTAGVGYAAYRAVGWADRIRSWAHSLPVDERD